MITHYLISDGTVNQRTNALIVESDSLSFPTLDEAIDQFIKDTGISREYVVVNPMHDPINHYDGKMVGVLCCDLAFPTAKEASDHESVCPKMTELLGRN